MRRFHIFPCIFWTSAVKLASAALSALVWFFYHAHFANTNSIQNIIGDTELLDRLPTMKMFNSRTISPAWWVKLHVKVDEIYFHWPSGWNRNRVFTIHICWIGKWISTTFQCAVYQNATFWRNSSSSTSLL